MRAAWLAALLLGAPSWAQAPQPRFVPTIGVDLESFEETLQVRVDGSASKATTSQLRAQLAVGLAHPVLALPGLGARLDGHASLGFGPAFDSGHWHLSLREDLTLARAVAPWLTLRGGLGLGGVLDTSAPPRSHLELGLALGVCLFDLVEVLYRPLWAVPLGVETHEVFSGQTLRTTSGLVPFDVALRFRFGALGW